MRRLFAGSAVSDRPHDWTQDRKNEIQTNLHQLSVEGDNYHGSWWSEAKFRRVFSFFEPFHDPSRTYKVLDLGCGGMTLTTALTRYPNFDIVGVDLVYEILRRIAKVRLPQVPVVTGDAQFLPFKTDSFDIVIHNQVLHHFSNREIILREIHRVLRPGGMLHSIETNGWNPYVIYEHYCSLSPMKPYISKNENPFSFPKYRAELRNSNFQILASRMINFNFIPLLTPFDSLFGKIPLFNYVFGGSMVVCARTI